MKNSIEEDIKYIEDVIALAITLPIEVKIQEEEIEAIQHILSDYKRVLKENEELHKEIDRMKSLDIYKLVEDCETGQLIPIQNIKDKIEELKEEKKKNTSLNVK